MATYWMPWADAHEKEVWAQIFRAAEEESDEEKALALYDIWQKYPDLINNKGTYRDFFYFIMENVCDLSTDDLYEADDERQEKAREEADAEMKAFWDEHGVNGERS